MTNRWNVVRSRIQAHLGERRSPKDRGYRKKRAELAADLGISDVRLKGFLSTKSKQPKSAALGFDKIGKLLNMEEFEDLRNLFSELPALPTATKVLREIQLELDFEGFTVIRGSRTLRLPIGKSGRLHLTITESA
jgi:hypothetical protein